MSYFDDHVQLDSRIVVNGVTLPETSSPVKITFNNISDGGRLADNIDYEGSLKGVKINIELNYQYLNKEHFDILFNATEAIYLQGGSFFMTIKVPTYTPWHDADSTDGTKTITGYFESTFESYCTDTTEKHEFGAEYQYGGSKYDELHENVVLKFIQK